MGKVLPSCGNVHENCHSLWDIILSVAEESDLAFLQFGLRQWKYVSRHALGMFPRRDLFLPCSPLVARTLLPCYLAV